MRARRLFLILCLALPGGVCGDPSSEPPAPRGVTLQLRLGSADPPASVHQFSVGRAIPVRVTLVNDTGSEARLPFSSGRTHDLILLDESGAEVWRWSNGRRFTQRVQELALPAETRQDIELECDPRRATGEPLSAGRYHAVAVLPVLDAEIRSEPIPLELR